jgi:hypothetical protein
MRLLFPCAVIVKLGSLASAVAMAEALAAGCSLPSGQASGPGTGLGRASSLPERQNKGKSLRNGEEDIKDLMAAKSEDENGLELDNRSRLPEELALISGKSART